MESCPAAVPAPSAFEASADGPFNSIVMSHTVTGVRDVPAQDFIAALASHLKNSRNFVAPACCEYIKTACYKELAPDDPDWFYTRAASIARYVYLKPDVGVGEMRRKYGGKKRRGARPNHFELASGSVIRRAMQGLAKIGYLSKTKRGRRITSLGMSELDRVARKVAKQITPKY